MSENTTQSLLLQEKYKDDNGHDIDASRVDVLAPYRHIADGFYLWSCGSCRHDHSSRSCGWPISGQVLKCDQCSRMNLLVRTNCAEIDAVLSGKWRSQEMEQENERLRGIERYNTEQLAAIRREIVAKVQGVLTT